MVNQSLTFFESYRQLWLQHGNYRNCNANLCTWLFLNANIFLHMVVYVVGRPIDAFHTVDLYPFFVLGIIMGGLLAWMPVIRRHGRYLLMAIGCVHGLWVMLHAFQLLRIY